MNRSNVLAVSFGEVLFDCFEDRTCIGGAPLNFAWNLHQFGFGMAMVSAVGRDELGTEVREFIERSGIESGWILERPEPTGTVDVRLTNGEPEFTVNENVAWDHIGFARDLETQPELIYFGTLAQRADGNRKALIRLLDAHPRHLFFDVNLRQNYYSPEIVLEGLARATLLKLNDEEWEVIRRIAGKDTPDEMLEHFGLEAIALTRGEEGAELYTPGQVLRARSAPVPVVDTVGAGDAFSAALAAGVMLGADQAHTLETACAAGAAVVQQSGAQIVLPKDVLGAFDLKA